MTGEADEYAAARSALLDALTALEPHLDAFVLVGAQAIYLRVGEADVAVPGSTTDGDLAIDLALLHDAPIIPEAMERAHFGLREERPGVKEPGIWELGLDGPTVDLLVPRSLRPVGRRGARLGIHGNQAAKTVPGLEGAFVDRDRMPIPALVPGDPLAADSAVRGRELLRQLFGERDSTGSLMAGRAAGVLDDPEAIAVSCAALTRDLLTGLSRR